MRTAPREGERGAREWIVPFDGGEQVRELPVGNRLLLDTPVVLRTGSSVVVAIERTGPSQWLLSDLGLTHAEAMFLGFATAFKRQLEETVAECGLDVDEASATILTRVDRVDQIAGAIACLANAARRAFDQALERQGSRAPKERIEVLARRLERLLSGAPVERSVEVVGSSTHRWRVDARIRRDGRHFLLDLVSPHPTSVATTVAKFHDLARLADPPVRIAVIGDREAMGTLLGVLSQAANVIEENAPDRAWRNLLAA